MQTEGRSGNEDTNMNRMLDKCTKEEELIKTVMTETISEDKDERTPVEV